MQSTGVSVAESWDPKQIASIDEFERELGRLRQRGWLFRGQSRTWGSLVPSIDRPPRELQGRAVKLFMERRSIQAFREDVRRPMNLVVGHRGRKSRWTESAMIKKRDRLLSSSLGAAGRAVGRFLTVDCSRRLYLRDCDFRRFAGTRLRLLVTGFVVLAASNKCRMPCSNSSTAFSKAPSCPTRTMATDKFNSNDGGCNTSTVPLNSFLAIKRAGSSPIPYPD
jgi:hypothetical protein